MVDWARRESNGPDSESHNQPKDKHLDETTPKAETERAAQALQTTQINTPESHKTDRVEQLAARLSALSPADKKRLAELLNRPTVDPPGNP